MRSTHICSSHCYYLVAPVVVDFDFDPMLSNFRTTMNPSSISNGFVKLGHVSPVALCEIPVEVLVVDLSAELFVTATPELSKHD